jgi:hypothetical protein
MRVYRILCLKKIKFNKQAPPNFPLGESFFGCEEKRDRKKERRKNK